jgi:chemotaxis protein methyltransferase CheR
MTTPTLAEPLLQAFSDFLAQRIGLFFPPPRWPDLLRGLARAAPAFGFPELEPCVRWLMRSELSRQQVEILASQLSVGETYFFREPGVFAALENDILPPLIAARRAAGRSLRLWSAGCCTGEEPYSLAILLERLIPDLADWSVSILATDINPDFLAKAKRGHYSEWSFRAAPAWLKAQCFETPAAGRYVLAPRLRRLVHFDYLNLAEDAYPSVVNHTNGIDIVLCRNVLMYFEASAAAAVARKLHRALVEGGCLIVSPTETSATIFPQFTTQHFPDAIVYRKSEPPSPMPAPAPPFVWPDAALAAAPEPLPETPPSAPNHTRAPATPPPATPYQTALAAYALGDYERVAALLAEPAGDDARALALLARASANQGRLTDASRWCEAAVAANKVDPGLRYLLASVLDEQGLAAPAVAALKQALYLDQDFILAHYALGNLYRRLEHPVLARRHFSHARQLLRQLPSGAALPDAEGLSAGRLAEIIDATEGLS